MRIKMIPFGEGDVIDVPSGKDGMGYSTQVNHFLGVIPGKRGARVGWLVYGVHAEQPAALHARKRRLKAVSA